MNLDDLKLSESLTALHLEARKLNELRRDGQINELWKALGVMQLESQKAMFRLLDLGGGK